MSNLYHSRGTALATPRFTSTSGVGGKQTALPGMWAAWLHPGPTWHHGRRETSRSLTAAGTRTPGSPGLRDSRSRTVLPPSPSARTPQSNSPSPCRSCGPTFLENRPPPPEPTGRRYHTHSTLSLCAMTGDNAAWTPVGREKRQLPTQSKTVNPPTKYWELWLQTLTGGSECNRREADKARRSRSGTHKARRSRQGHADHTQASARGPRSSCEKGSAAPWPVALVRASARALKDAGLHSPSRAPPGRVSGSSPGPGRGLCKRQSTH